MYIDKGRIMNDFIEPNKSNSIEYLCLSKELWWLGKEQCEKLFEGY